MYYILEGSGLMTVDDEERQVSVGNCIFFSSLSRHGLENTGGTVLRYLSAASPSFKKEDSRKLESTEFSPRIVAIPPYALVHPRCAGWRVRFRGRSTDRRDRVGARSSSAGA
jgi:hypothetical protein